MEVVEPFLSSPRMAMHVSPRATPTPSNLLSQMGSGWDTWNQTEPNPQICCLRWVLTGLLRTKPQICRLKWVLVELPQARSPKLQPQMGPGWVT